jgi:Zn-finger nucleic acid-binding protein
MDKEVRPMGASYIALLRKEKGSELRLRAPSQTLCGVRCPRDKAELRQVVSKGTTIDVCDRCHGRWLDEGELEQLVLSGTQIGTAETLRGALAAVERRTFFREVEGDSAIACPRCGVAMHKVRFESRGAEAMADRCGKCSGFWLDSGETGALFVFLEENLPVRRVVWAWVAVALGLALAATYWFLGA